MPPVMEGIASDIHNRQMHDSLLHIAKKREIKNMPGFELFCCILFFLSFQGLKQQLQQIEMAEHQSMIQPEPMDLSLSDTVILKEDRPIKQYWEP